MDANTRSQLADDGSKIASFKTGGRGQSAVKLRMVSLRESWRQMRTLTFRAWGHKSRQRGGLISEQFGYGLIDDFQSTANVRSSNECSIASRTFPAPYLVIRVTRPLSLSGFTTERIDVS